MSPIATRFGTPHRSPEHCTSTSRQGQSVGNKSGFLHSVKTLNQLRTNISLGRTQTQTSLRQSKSSRRQFFLSVEFPPKGPSEADATWRTKDTTELGDCFLKDSCGASHPMGWRCLRIMTCYVYKSQQSFVIHEKNILMHIESFPPAVRCDVVELKSVLFQYVV